MINIVFFLSLILVLLFYYTMSFIYFPYETVNQLTDDEYYEDGNNGERIFNILKGNNVSILIINEIYPENDLNDYNEKPAIAYAAYAGLLVMKSTDNTSFFAATTIYQRYLDPPMISDSLVWMYPEASVKEYSFIDLINRTLFPEYNVAVLSSVIWTFPNLLSSNEIGLYLFLEN